MLKEARQVRDKASKVVDRLESLRESYRRAGSTLGEKKNGPP